MKKHGDVNIYWKDNILYLEAFGPFNEEGVIDVANKYLNSIINRDVVKFSVIEIWDEDSLSSPAGMKNVEKLWGQLEANDCTSFALVVCNSVQRAFAEPLIPSIGEIFKSRKEAEQWVLKRNST